MTDAVQPTPDTVSLGRSPRVMAGLCILLAGVLPLATAGALVLDWPQTLLTVGAKLGVSLPAAEQPAWSLWLATALALLPVLAMSAAMLRASRCLRAFARGAHFSLAAVQDLRGFAAWMCVAGIAGVVIPTLLVLLLTSGGQGSGRLAISVGSPQLVLLLFAGVTWHIAAALAKAVALAEEHAQFV